MLSEHSRYLPWPLVSRCTQEVGSHTGWVFAGTGALSLSEPTQASLGSSLLFLPHGVC